MKRKKNFISFVGLKNIMRQGISLSPVLSTRVVTSYILVIINPFSTQDIIRISSRSLNADHNSDPCHAKKKKIGIPYNIPRCSRRQGLWFPIPYLMIPYFDSSVCRRLFLDPLPPFYTSEPLAIVFARAHSVWRDARSPAKNLSLFIDLPSLQKNSEIKLALNYKTSM